MSLLGEVCSIFAGAPSGGRKPPERTSRRRPYSVTSSNHRHSADHRSLTLQPLLATRPVRVQLIDNKAMRRGTFGVPFDKMRVPVREVVVAVRDHKIGRAHV